MGSSAVTVRPRRRLRVRRPVLFAWAVMLPLIAWQLVFTGIPLVMAFIQSLETGPLIARVHPFVGFDNYTYELTQDPTFINTIRNTVIFAATAMLFGNVASLGLALLVGRIRRLAGLFRTIFYLPSVCTAVAVASVWKFIYDSSNGILNQMLTGLGLPGQNWLGLNLALPSIIGMSVWWGIGGGMLIYLAGLQGVDATLYEAARVDGAGSWRLFWHITLTQLRPMLVFQSILGIIGGMQVFTQPYLLTQGGPVDATRSMVEYMYETAFAGGGGDFGTAAAISFMLFALVFVLVATELWLVRRREQT